MILSHRPHRNPEERDALIKSISLLKRNALAAPFELAFTTQKELATSGTGQGELLALHYRDEEAIYVQASSDRATVIFSTIFREETDRIFGKVFLQVNLHRHEAGVDLSYCMAGICRCQTTADDSKRSASFVYNKRPSFRTSPSPWPDANGRRRICYVHPLPSPFRQCNSHGVHDQSHSEFPGLSSLPHQVLKGLHALSYALPCQRVPKGTEQGKDRSCRNREEDGQVRVHRFSLYANTDAFSVADGL